MKQSTLTVWVCLPLLLVMFTGVSASSWTCQKSDLSRHVVLFYPDEPARLPCKVMYSKPTENVMPHPLWESVNTQDYCERKAMEFVTKLESMGWRCAEDELQQGSSSDVESTPADKPE